MSVLPSVHHCGSTVRNNGTGDARDESPASEVWPLQLIVLMVEMSVTLSEPQVPHQ